MNKIFKVIFSKAKGCYVVTSEIAKTHAKSTSKTTAKILTALILTAMAGMGSSYAADNVTYDDAYAGNTRITLTTGGVVVDNVANGDMAKGSKQAVNGGQLYDVNQKVIAFDGKLATVQTNISKVQGNVANLTTTVVNMKDTVDTVNDTLNNGITMTANGKTIKNINPSDMSFNYKAGKNISLTADANGSLVITAKADGKVTAGDTNLVSGDAVNTAIKAETTARTAAESAINNKIGTMAADGHYAKVANSISANITALDTQAKKNADAISTETTARTNAIAQEVRDRNAAIQKETNARTTAETAIKNSIGTMAADGSYAKKANSLSANITALDTQAKKNADAIAQEVTNRGTAITNAINKEVNDRNTAITTAKTELQGQLTTLSGNAVQYTDATKASIALGGANGTKITNVKAGDISKADSTDAVNGGQLYTTNQNVAKEIEDRKAAISDEANKRAQADQAINTKIGTMTADGNYAKIANSISANITALDTQAKKNADAISAETTARTNAIAQEVTDRNAAIKVETDARTKAETAIKNSIGTMAADGSYAKKANSLSANITALDTQAKANADAIAQEVTNRGTAITNAINKEVNDRNTAITAAKTELQGQLTTLSSNAVQYTDATKASIALGGAKGTKITNVMAGDISKADSTDAVNGGQLFTTNKNLATEISDRKAAIAQEVKDRDAAIKVETDARKDSEAAINKAITNIQNMTTITDAGKTQIKNLSKEAVKVAQGENITITAAEDEDGNKTYTVKATMGTVAKGQTGLVSGDAVNTAIEAEKAARTTEESKINNKIGTMAADGSYAKKANSLSANITALDIQAKKNADAIAQEVTNRGTAITNAINKEVNDRNTAITAAKTELQGQLTTLSGNAVQYTDATKTSIALGGAKGTKITNVMAGDISKADSTDAVNGGQLFTTNTNLATEISDRKAAIAQEVKDRDAAIKVETDARKESEAAINKAITNIQNMTTITDAGKTQIKELSKEAVKVAQGENITITTAEDENGNKTYTVKATMGTVAKGQTGLVSGDAVNTAIEAEKAARTQAVNTINNTIGTIAENGNYIQKAGTISANLSALDVGLHGLQTTYNTRAAKYDGDDNVLMTLAGKGGTRITNLKEGAVTTTSTDAINGSQLANTESKINGIRDSIDTNTTNITKLTETMNANQTTISSTSEMVNTIANNRVNTNLSNLTVQGQNKLKNLVQEEIANYMKTQGQTEETTATVKATPAKVQAANIMTAGSGDPVTYDDAYEGNTRITLTTGGAVVDNVSDGEIAKGSKQAVNGGQLFTMQQTFAQYDGRIATIQGNIAKNQGNIATNTTKLITLGDKVSDITDAMNTGINVTVDGHTTTTITKDNPQLEFTSGEYITLANKNGKISVSVNPNGTAAPGNKGLMTGDAVYQAIKDIPTNTTLNGKTDTNLGNLTDEGKTNIKNLAKEAVTVEGGNHITVESTVDEATGNKKYTVNVNANGQIAEGNTGLITGDAAYKYVDEKIKNATVNTDQIKQAMKEDLDKKADTTYVDQKLQEKADKTYVDTELSKKVNADGTGIDADKFSQKVAIGEVKEGENRAVSGDAVNKAIANATQNLKESTVDKDLSNISDKAKDKIGDIAKNSVKVIAGTNTTVTESTDGNAKTYQVNVSNESIKAAVKTDLDQKLNKDLSNLSEEAKNTIKGTMKEDLDKKVNTDASNIDKEKWTEQLGTGNVTKDNKELVTGGTVYDALQKVNASTGLIDSSDGSMHIGKEDSSTKVDFTNKDGKGRVLTGIVTDEKDASSAANVGYVAKNMEQAYADMNQGFSRLNSSINKGVAGANALAALHPMEFDPGDKMSFAVGYGHYKGGNAAAIGAYYRPNENIMVNAGVSFGNGETGINAGVSFKLGQGSAYNGVSKAQMIDTINNQATTIEEIQADNKNKDSRIENLEQENQEMKKQIQEILKTLGK